MIKKIFNKLFHKVEKISFKESMDLTDMPVITLYQGDKKLNLLLDTGSNHNVISSHVIEDLKYENTGETSSIVGMEGKPRDASVCRLSLTYKDRVYVSDYIVNDLKDAFDHIKQTTGVTLHGMLGAKFFNEYKYILDFESLVAYSKA